MGSSHPMAALLLLFISWATRVLAYSEPCPEVCRCSVAELECGNVSESSWHSILLYLSAPDATTILTVRVHGGEVSTLTFFPYLQHLETLEISGTSLNRVNFPSNIRYPNLRNLDLSQNFITELTEDSLIAFPNLETLSLRNNNITLLKYEQLKLIKLRRLDLSFNQIMVLPIRVFRLLGSLERLDLSGNRLRRAMSSDFQSQQRLRNLNISHNDLVQFDFDTFAKNVMIEELDLSYNNLRRSPGADLKSVVNLLSLNISGNPIEKISSWDFEFDRLQMIVASHMPSLRVVDASAFSKSRDLRIIDLSMNPSLKYISPSAFQNCTSIHSLDIRESGLEILFANNLRDVAQVAIAGSPLNCECMASEVDNIASITIDDWEEVKCAQEDGQLIKLSDAKTGSCPPKPILPFGNEVTATLGSTYSLYCGARSEGDEVEWRLPNGTVMEGQEPMKPVGLSVMDYFSNSLYHPDSNYVPSRPRIYASREWMRLDVVAAWDEGEYQCTVKRGKKIKTEKLLLRVKKVHIDIEAVSSGPHYVSLAWNQTLQIQAVDRVALRLRIRDSLGHERPIQLSLHNPWTTYNVMRLRPNMNYSICLEYALAENLDRPLLSACTDTSTQPIVSFFSSIDPKILLIVFSFIFFLIVLNSARGIYVRMHIWQQAKKRSRMAASLSGQSIVSHTSTHNATYENQQLALCRVDSSSETRACLLTSDLQV